MKKVLQNKDKSLGLPGKWKVITMTLLLLTFSIGQMWGASTTYTYTGYTTQIANGWTHNYGDTYVGRKGSNYTPDNGGLPTGNSNIFAAFQVSAKSKIRVVFVLTKTNGDLSDKSVALASLSEETYNKLVTASTGTGNDVKYSISNFSSSQSKAVAINRADANKEITFEFDDAVSAGYYAVYTASSINSSALIKKIIVVPTHTLTWDFDGGSSSATAGEDYTAGGDVAEGATITYPVASTMSKSGSEFNGWSSSATTMPTTNLTITAQWTAASSCAATIPGNITKGTASGGTGIITLTAGGDIASGDTWYWQDAADGTATDKGSGKTKNVNAAGTYYVRSYNTTGECWSAAKSVTVAAEDLVTHYTITYSKGTNGTGDAIANGDKVHGEDFTLSSSTYTRAGYRQTGWSETDGGDKAYDLGGTYSTDADEELFPFWTPVYTVTKGTHANGDFTISPASQVAGGTVTLDPTPADGFMFSAWEIVKTSDASATGITVTNKQFEMPAYGVTVNATFVTDTRKKVLILVDKLSGGNWTGTGTDKLYAALKDAYNVTVAVPDGQTLTDYDLIVLHESIGGSNTNAAVTGCKTTSVPVLNTKTYFYGGTNDASSRWQWGAPNGGQSIKGCTLNSGYCNAASHPIFADVTINEGFVEIINTAEDKCMQPVVPVSGKEGYLLATSPNAATPGGNGYAIQEIPAGGFRGATSGKYLLISASNGALSKLNANGQKLFQNAAAYLVSDETWTPVAGLTNAEIDATGNPFSEGATMTLTASATGATAATTYAWYKGATWSEAEAGGAIQAAKTAENSGHIYTKTAAAEDADKYWCVMVKSTGCEVTASVEVSVVSCTKPGTPANLAASNLAYTTADLSWDAADNSDGYKISIIKKDDESVIVDWTDNATTSYAATGLTQGTEYTFKVKAKGATGYCEFGLEATVDFSTTAPSVADLVTIADDYTFTPSATIAAGTLAESNKFFGAGTDDCDYGSGMRVKENRALAFKVNNGARVKVTFSTNGDREMQLGTDKADDDNKAYGHTKTSPATFDVTADGVVYLTASSDLRFSKLEIMYPHTVTYDLNGGTGDPVPTQASKYVGETFTAHDGVTGITAPSGQEFEKWKDQDAADVAASATYTMPAKNVTLTAQWRAETVKYTVTYDLADYTAGVAPTETNKAEGDVFAIKAAPSRAGYAFMGWLCDIDAQTYQATDDYTMTAAATTFTAVWKQEFQVSFNLQGYGTPIAPQIIVDGGKVVKPADPEEMLYEFGGWYKEAACTNAWDFDNDVVTANTPLFAKWTEFDGCVYMAPVASGDALVVGDNVNLKTGSFGGTVKVAGLSGAGKIAYNAAGLAFTGGGGDSIRVTLTEKMMAGTKITVRLQSGGESARGLKLQTLAKSNVTTLGWSSATTNGAVASFTYTVVADDGLDGKKAFLLSRNNTVYLKYISVENCAPEEFVVTYMDGESTMGTENVYSGNHPTATGISTHKVGYAFQGWKETADGSVVELNTITISAAKTLYAAYAAIDCSGNGVKFSQVAKANTLEADYSLSGTTEVSIGEYATVTGGEVYLNNNSSNTRVKITQTTSVIQLTGGDEGYIHVLLDCPLKTGDTIKADNTNKWVIAHNASKTDKVQLASGEHYFVVTDGWNNKGEFYIWRDGSSCNISTIKVIRPAKYTVSFNMKGHGSAIADIENVLEGSKITAPSPAPTDEDYSFAGWYKETTLENEWDFDNDVVNANTTLYAKWLDKSDATLKSLKYGATDIELEDAVYVYEIALPSATASVPALTAVTSNPNANAEVTNAASFDEEGKATSTVEVTPEKEGAAHLTYTVKFSKLAALPQVNVTEATEWNFSQGGSTTLQNQTDVVLANLPGINNNATFNSQALLGTFNKMEGTYFQGSKLSFTTEVAGKLTITFRGTNNNSRHLQICLGEGEDVVADWNYQGSGESAQQVKTIFVPVGKVTLKAFEGTDAQNVRIYHMELNTTPDYTRTLQSGMLSTTCLPNGGVIVGASVFEIAYMDYEADGTTPHKIYFDEVEGGIMEAGIPYIVLANEGSTQMGVFYTDNENRDAQSKNGLVGYIGGGRSLVENEWFIYDNMFFFVNAADAASGRIHISNNRAYLDVDHIPGSATYVPVPGRRRLSMGNGSKQTPMGMDELNAGDTPVKVMINGQLYILRGEKMYDATGRLVK